MSPSTSLQLDAILQLLRDPSDARKLVGLTLAVRLFPAANAETLRAVHDAIGWEFLMRLLLPIPPSDNDDDISMREEVNRSLAITLCAAFSRLEPLAPPRDWEAFLPVLVRTLANEPSSSSSSDATVVDALETLCMLLSPLTRRRDDEASWRALRARCVNELRLLDATVQACQRARERTSFTIVSQSVTLLGLLLVPPWDQVAPDLYAAAIVALSECLSLPVKKSTKETQVDLIHVQLDALLTLYRLLPPPTALGAQLVDALQATPASVLAHVCCGTSLLLRGRLSPALRLATLSVLYGWCSVVGNHHVLVGSLTMQANQEHDMQPGSLLELVTTSLLVETHVLSMDLLDPEQTVPRQVLAYGGDNVEQAVAELAVESNDEQIDVRHLRRVTLPMELPPDQAVRREGGFALGTETAGERANRILPVVLALWEACIDALASQELIPENVCMRILRTMEQGMNVWFDLLQSIDTLPSSKTRDSILASPGLPLIVRTISRFAAEAPDAIASRLWPSLGLLLRLHASTARYLLPALSQLLAPAATAPLTSSPLASLLTDRALRISNLMLEHTLASSDARDLPLLENACRTLAPVLRWHERSVEAGNALVLDVKLISAASETLSTAWSQVDEAPPLLLLSSVWLPLGVVAAQLAVLHTPPVWGEISSLWTSLLHEAPSMVAADDEAAFWIDMLSESLLPLARQEAVRPWLVKAVSVHDAETVDSLGLAFVLLRNDVMERG